MRRIIFISDLHSNLPALDVVLGKVKGEEVICLGDIVGYGSSPNEVVERLRERKVLAIKGNHDSAVVDGDTSMFNARAAMVVEWTRAQLKKENRGYLASLPLQVTAEFEGVRSYFTHGSPDDNLWEYVHPATHSDLFGHYLTRLAIDLIGLGHTHIPFVWTGREGTVFNPGSVGQPRDMDRRASYALATLDGGKVRVELRRVEYDYEAAAKGILKAGLPPALAERLLRGA